MLVSVKCYDGICLSSPCHIVQVVQSITAAVTRLCAGHLVI